MSDNHQAKRPGQETLKPQLTLGIHSADTEQSLRPTLARWLSPRLFVFFAETFLSHVIDSCRKERTRLRKAAYYQAHKEQYRLNYQEHKEEKCSYQIAYNHAHSKEKRSYDTIYRNAHKEHINLSRAPYRQAHKAETRAYQQAHKVELAVKSAKRRAVIQGSTVGDLAQIKEIYRIAAEEPKVCCYLCNRLIPLGDRHVDHIFPISGGGSTRPSNLAVTCSTCNLKKGSKHPNEVGVLI